MMGLACHGRTCVTHWGGAVARFLQGGLALKLGLHTVLGWHRSSVTVSLVHCDRMVAADFRVVKGVSVTLVKKGTKKRNKKTYLYLRACDGGGGTCKV